MIDDTLYTMVMGYLRHCLSLFLSTHLIRSGRRGMFQIPFLRECHPTLPWKRAFSVMVTDLWNRVSPNIWLALTLMTSCKALKTWFCCQALAGPIYSTSYTGLCKLFYFYLAAYYICVGFYYVLYSIFNCFRLLTVRNINLKSYKLNN